MSGSIVCQDDNLMTEKTRKVHAVVMWLDYTVAIDADKVMKAIVAIQFHRKEGTFMQVSSQGAPVARRWAQTLYLVVASLILLAIFLQGFLIGAFLFAGALWGRDAHSIVGLVLVVLSLLLALVGLLAQVPGRTKLWGFLLFVLMIIQFILPSTSGSVPLLAALHPANAMILFGLSLFLIFRIQQVKRANE